MFFVDMAHSFMHFACICHVFAGHVLSIPDYLADICILKVIGPNGPTCNVSYRVFLYAYLGPYRKKTILGPDGRIYEI